MKRLTILLLTLFLLSNISALKINEIEINPALGSAEKEWVEIYNEGEEINVSQFTINDSLKKRYTFENETFIPKNGYYIVEFKTATLNNDGDSLALINPLGEIIYSTGILKEEKNSSKTWQLCENNWEFIEATRGEENNCPTPEEIPVTPPANDSTSEGAGSAGNEGTGENPGDTTTGETIPEENEEEQILLNKISLAPKNIKSENEASFKKNIPLYGFIAFCVFLGILFLLKKKAFSKTRGLE